MNNPFALPAQGARAATPYAGQQDGMQHDVSKGSIPVSKGCIPVANGSTFDAKGSTDDANCSAPDEENAVSDAMCSLPDAKCSILDGSNSIDPDMNLSDAQAKAIRFTLEGKADRVISAALDVSRTTLWRWKTHDPNFRTVLANARKQLQESFADRIRNDLIETAKSLKALYNHCTDDKLRAHIGEILMRHGYRYLEQQQNQTPAAPLSPRTLKLLKASSKASAHTDDDLVD